MDFISMNLVIEKGLPIYLHGAFGQKASEVIAALKKCNGTLSAVFDQNYLAAYNTDIYMREVDSYASKGLNVESPPNDVTSLPQGIVIIAVRERNQRDVRAHWIKNNYHIVYDAETLLFSSAYETCYKMGIASGDLLYRCKTCIAGARSCPIRQVWCETNGRKSGKVIRHLAIKAGFICNLKCSYCCEFINLFEEKHKRQFDTDGLISDIRKLSDSLEYVGTLSFSGGDVLLNKGLARVLEATLELVNIGDIYMLTNGTYIPPFETLDVIQKNSEHFRIEINGYEINKQALPLITELTKRGIKHRLRDNIGWYDFNNLHFRSRSVIELRQIYNLCAFDNNMGYYHIMTEGKLNQRCGVANGIMYFLDNYHLLTQDYIDIRLLTKEQIPLALTALEDRGYLDACNFCASAPPGERPLGSAKDQLKVD